MSDAAHEDDVLEVDSPEQPALDDILDEDYGGDLDDLSALPPPASSAVTMKRERKLQKPKEKPREKQLQYMESVPYECESLQEMDNRLEEIVRRLIDCVKAKD